MLLAPTAFVSAGRGRQWCDLLGIVALRKVKVEGPWNFGHGSRLGLGLTCGFLMLDHALRLLGLTPLWKGSLSFSETLLFRSTSFLVRLTLLFLGQPRFVLSLPKDTINVVSFGSHSDAGPMIGPFPMLECRVALAASARYDIATERPRKDPDAW